MALIRVNDVQEGMELSEPVVDQHGRLLLPVGKELGERELRLLKMWGVVEVDIAGIDDGDAGLLSPSVDPELLAECEPLARDLFRHAGTEHEALAPLFRECILRLARQRNGEGADGH